jgi:hypothetical protein
MKRKDLKSYAEMMDDHDLRLDHALENQKASLLQTEMRKKLRNLKKKAREREEEMAYNQAQPDIGSPDLDFSVLDDYV